jgi:predicted dehydrogenase
LVCQIPWEGTSACDPAALLTFDIHAIDGAIWLLGRRAAVATGLSRIVRDDPHGDSCDASSYQFEYASGVIHEHSGLALPTGEKSELACRVHGQSAGP